MLSIHLLLELHKLYSDLLLRALPVSSHGQFCQFLLIACMVACAPPNKINEKKGGLIGIGLGGWENSRLIAQHSFIIGFT